MGPRSKTAPRSAAARGAGQSASRSLLGEPASIASAKTLELTAGFGSHLAHERRLAPLTVESYQHDVGMLVSLMGARELESLSVHDIRRFVAKLHASGLSGRSLARKLSAWRSLFRYLARDHGFQVNPVDGMHAPKSPKRLPATLSPDQAAQLLDADDSDENLEQRDAAMFELIYSSGLRLSEVIGVTIDAISFEDGTVRVTGKGSKTRVVPVGKPALKAIREWLKIRPLLAKQDAKTLFLSSRGGKLDRRHVGRRLSKLALKRGLDTKVYPHMLRHSFASHVLQSSGDLRAVQEMLGHASISTTQVYTHLDFQHLAKVYDAAHPRAKKK